MKKIAMVLLFDRQCRLLVYLRDDKPDIPFPNHWDFFGGHVEEGETSEEALVREVKEEIAVELKQWVFFRRYVCTEGDAYPNIKYLYWSTIDKLAEELTLYEGQHMKDSVSRLSLLRSGPNCGLQISSAKCLRILSAAVFGRGLWITFHVDLRKIN